jgi:TPR repeat protein
VTYNEGRVVKQDHAEAVKWFHKATGQRCALAQGAIGSLYFSGQGVAVDLAETATWY